MNCEDYMAIENILAGLKFMYDKECIANTHVWYIRLRWTSTKRQRKRDEDHSQASYSENETETKRNEKKVCGNFYKPRSDGMNGMGGKWEKIGMIYSNGLFIWCFSVY